MYALIFDLDGVGLAELRNLFLRFGGQSRVEEPVARVLVETHGGHHRGDAGRQIGFENLEACLLYTSRCV